MIRFKSMSWEPGDETPRTISGENFSSFLELCFRNADLFSMNRARWTICTIEDLQRELEPFLEKEVLTLRWYGYDFSKAPHPNLRIPINVYLYRTDPAAKDILLKYFPDVFLWFDRTNDEPLQTLEDLCFFSQGQLLAGTISHERILRVYPTDSEFETRVKALGDWIYEDEAPVQMQEFMP